MGKAKCNGYINMTFSRDWGYEYGNQFCVSFGLADRYLILIVTKYYSNLRQRRIKVTSLAGEKVHPLRCARFVHSPARRSALI